MGSGLSLLPLILTLVSPWEGAGGFRWLPPGQQPVVLTFTGDIMAHDVNFRMPDYSRIYENLVPLLQADDLTFGNLEFPVDPSKPMSSYPSFNVHPSYVEAAVKAGFEAFSLANNHSNDHKEDSMRATLASLKGINFPGLIYHGLRTAAGKPEPAAQIEVRGLKIGLISVTSLLNQPRGKDFIEYYPYADFYTGKVDEKIAQELEDRIRREKTRCDLLIVGFHDGLEYVHKPYPAQVKMYRRLVEAGADIIWGHHPHVVLPVEVYRTGSRQGLILYSLGNFISGQTWRLKPEDKASDRARTGDGILVQVQVHRTRTGVLPVLGEITHLNNYKHPVHGMITGPTSHWASTLENSAWQEYYRHRLEVQKKVIETPPVSAP